MKTQKIGGEKVLVSVKESDIVDGVFLCEEATEIADGVLNRMPTLKKLVLPKVKKLGNYCLSSNDFLTTLDLPVCTTMGNHCLSSNASLTTLDLPVCTTMGNHCLSWNDFLTTLDLPVCTTMGNHCLSSNDFLTTLDLPVCTTMGNDCLRWNASLTTVSFGNYKLSVKNVDGYCFVVEKEKTSKGIRIYTGYNLINVKDSVINKQECYVAEKENFTTHGETVKKAISDLNFKIVADKLKNEPIEKDTVFTVEKYRLITGACDLGCRDWMQRNNIPFNITKEDKTIESAPIKAIDLLPLLRKSNAYGIDKIESLITF
ncbi:MAG: leucine-rich repeat protein [Pedobacter sp.]|jgi:spore coat protein U-like protein|uniref:leucine-rich repeat protein n=1 Tax=Pedobacter sp. TaxID=1411316 RepID=UPI003563F3FA